MRNLEGEGGQEIASRGLGLAPAVLLGKTRVRGPQDGWGLGWHRAGMGMGVDLGGSNWRK